MFNCHEPAPGDLHRPLVSQQGLQPHGEVSEMRPSSPEHSAQTNSLLLALPHLAQTMSLFTAPAGDHMAVTSLLTGARRDCSFPTTCRRGFVQDLTHTGIVCKRQPWQEQWLNPSLLSHTAGSRGPCPCLYSQGPGQHLNSATHCHVFKGFIILEKKPEVQQRSSLLAH